MQLVIQRGAVFDGRRRDIVFAHHPDGQTLPPDAYPGCVIVPFAGEISDLERLAVGPEPESPQLDLRPILAPADIDLVAYAAAARYGRERGTVTVKSGRDKIPVSIAPADRVGLRDQLQDIGAGIRADGDVYKFADGVARALSNDAMKAVATTALRTPQLLRNAEAQIAKDVAAGKVQTLDEVDAALDAVLAG